MSCLVYFVLEKLTAILLARKQFDIFAVLLLREIMLDSS
jgi:hypothetical protein